MAAHVSLTNANGGGALAGSKTSVLFTAGIVAYRYPAYAERRFKHDALLDATRARPPLLMRTCAIARRAWFALAIAELATFPAFADPAKLAAGDAFPPVEAESVSGTRVVLPADRQGDGRQNR